MMLVWGFWFWQGLGDAYGTEDFDPLPITILSSLSLLLLCKTKIFNLEISQVELQLICISLLITTQMAEKNISSGKKKKKGK